MARKTTVRSNRTNGVSGSGKGDGLTHAYRRLRELIVTGRLVPGTRVVEADLADRLDLSRTPVRGALHRLQQEGYLVVGSGGPRQSRLAVAPLTKEDASELYWLIAHVEGLAAQLAAGLEAKVRSKLVSELERLNNALATRTKETQGNPRRIFDSEIIDLDIKFHGRIVEASAGPRLWALHNAIRPQTERYWRCYASEILGELGLSVAEHERVIRGISRGDRHAAEEAMRTNWVNAGARLCRVIDAHGERGSW